MGLQSTTITLHEFPVVASKTKETTQAFSRLWVWVVFHSLLFLGIHSRPCPTNDVTQVLDFKGAKRGFGMFDEQLVILDKI